jgi:hypothetical protein
MESLMLKRHLIKLKLSCLSLLEIRIREVKAKFLEQASFNRYDNEIPSAPILTYTKVT